MTTVPEKCFEAISSADLAHKNRTDVELYKNRTGHYPLGLRLLRDALRPIQKKSPHGPSAGHYLSEIEMAMMRWAMRS